MNAASSSDALLGRAAELMDHELGLRPDPTLRGRLQRCLRDEAAARGESLAGYVARLAADPNARQGLFDRLTVQETAFFRHPGQFQALAERVLPGIDGPAVIWSAGCSNGQEPYSLAMILEEQAAPGSVIATDVSTQALRRTSEGSYHSRELTGLSSVRRDRYLTGGPGGSRWEVCKQLRDRVTVQHHNLITDPLPDHVARCQVVFCRNVLIYFSTEHVTAFLTRLAGALAPGACLFLGYAETIWQVPHLFEPVRLGEAFEYHRRRDHPPPTAVHTPARPARPVRPARNRPAAPSGRLVPAGPAAGAEGGGGAGGAGGVGDAGGDRQAAIGQFRRYAFLEPDQPIAHLQLGLALEAAGDLPSAQRAYRAARSALERSEVPAVESALGGYRVEELIRLLDSKQESRKP
ncbi:MAG TPA: protein-glutamate O-methyltransferase CheR [Actinomycetota bacterium]|jgi:chemotaxis protein methyltransferase CheR